MNTSVVSPGRNRALEDQRRLVRDGDGRVPGQSGVAPHSHQQLRPAGIQQELAHGAAAAQAPPNANGRRVREEARREPQDPPPGENSRIDLELADLELRKGFLRRGRRAKRVWLGSGEHSDAILGLSRRQLGPQLGVVRTQHQRACLGPAAQVHLHRLDAAPVRIGEAEGPDRQRRRTLAEGHLAHDLRYVGAFGDLERPLRRDAGGRNRGDRKIVVQGLLLALLQAAQHEGGLRRALARPGGGHRAGRGQSALAEGSGGAGGAEEQRFRQLAQSRAHLDLALLP